jgi:hypothetical protein
MFNNNNNNNNNVKNLTIIIMFLTSFVFGALFNEYTSYFPLNKNTIIETNKYE